MQIIKQGSLKSTQDALRFPRLLGLYMMVGPFIASILFLFPPNSVTRPFLEWMMLLAAFLWLIPESLLILKNFKSD